MTNREYAQRQEGESQMTRYNRETLAAYESATFAVLDALTQLANEACQHQNIHDVAYFVNEARIIQRKLRTAMQRFG